MSNCLLKENLFPCKKNDVKTEKGVTGNVFFVICCNIDCYIALPPPLPPRYPPLPLCYRWLLPFRGIIIVAGKTYMLCLRKDFCCLLRMRNF